MFKLRKSEFSMYIRAQNPFKELLDSNLPNKFKNHDELLGFISNTTFSR